MNSTAPNAFSDADSFARYAKVKAAEGVTHIPVIKQTLADLDTPVSTYLKLAGARNSYLFESVEGGNKWGRYSIIGLPCKQLFSFHGDQLKIEKDGQVSTRTCDNPWQFIRQLQADYRVDHYTGLPDMIGGLVGYFGYESIAYIEPKLAHINKPDPLGTPDILLMLSTDVLVFDNLLGRIFIVTLAEIKQENAWQMAMDKLVQIESQLASSAINHKPRDNQPSPAAETSHFPQADFLDAVSRARQYIKDGDIMQVVLSQRLSVPFAGSAFDVYRALRTINPSPYMYYLNLGEFEIVGSSPEILVRKQQDKITVRPIAGTRPRGQTEAQDKALETDLLNDAKELAEHLMLIDLGRNDIGRIAQTGSVKLTDKMTVERYSHVMHIVSNIEARLLDGLDALDVFQATFPAGTVSGAAKIRAMEIIAELEPIKRGIYSGAVGYLGWNGNMDTAIAIRTAVVKDQLLNIQAGAGIVADSVPENEWQETLNKARVVLKAVAMAESGLGVHEC